MAEQLFRIPFHYYSQQAFGEVRERAQHLTATDLSDEQGAVATLVAQYRLDKIDVDLDKLVALPGHREEEAFRSDFFGDRQRTVTPIYTFELPYTGSSDLWRISPSSSRLIHLEADIRSSKLSFEIRGADKSRLDQIKDGIQINIGNQSSEIAGYNSQLEDAAKQAVSRRSQELQQHDDGLNAFGVPVKSGDV